MKKSEFLSELALKLKRLPQSEIDAAINYYEEYFDEAGEENEQTVIEELISPSAVAAKLIGEYAVKDAETNIQREKDNTKKRTNPFLLVILGVFALPIGVPLAVAFAAVIFALLISVLAVGFSFVVSGGAVVLTSVVTAGVGIFTLFSHFGTGLFLLGSGLFGFAAGMAVCIGMFKLTKLILFGLQKSFGRLLIKRGAK